jgi:hypothetical protein
MRHVERVTQSALDRMPLWRRRSLTSGEIDLGRIVFQEEIPWSEVGVLQGPSFLPFGAMVPLGCTIVFARWRAREDFAAAPINEQAWFVHELAHVWQAARGTMLAGAKLRALGKRAYRYKALPHAKFLQFNIERQAEIARHLFLARLGKPEPNAPPRDWLEAVWESRWGGWAID